MCMILIDAVVLGIIIAVMEEDDFPGWIRMILCVIAILGSTVLLQAILPGPFGLLGIVGGAIVGGFAISGLCGMSVKRAAIAASIYLAYRIAIELAFFFFTQ